MSDEDEVARHPWKATATAFLFVWLAVTPYAYFRADHRNLLVSALIGVALGLVVVVLVLGGIGQLRGWPGWVSGRPGQVLRPPIGLAVLWAGAGLGVLVWGATRGSFQLVLVGLPLIALAFFWYLIKRSLLP
jgi:hypothetical protein